MSDAKEIAETATDFAGEVDAVVSDLEENGATTEQIADAVDQLVQDYVEDYVNDSSSHELENVEGLYDVLDSIGEAVLTGDVEVPGTDIEIVAEDVVAAIIEDAVVETLEPSEESTVEVEEAVIDQ